MNKSIISLIVLSTINFCAMAQDKAVLAANKLYDEKSYSEAIPTYEKVIKKDSTNALVLSKLADCYRLTNNAKGQMLCYGKLVTSGKAEPIQKLYYGEALMELGRYDEATKVMDEYTGDSRGKVFSKSIANLKAFSKNEDAYKVDSVSFNSTENDFSPTMFNGFQIVFTSSRNKTSWISRKHGWTGNNYYSLYTTEKDLGGKFFKPTLFMKDLQSKYNDGPVCFGRDNKTVYFTRNNSKKKAGQSAEGTYKLKIFQATLNVDGFERVYELPFNNKEYNCAHPSLSPDGQTLYFASDMGGGMGGLDIWCSKMGADGVWGTPKNMGDKVNTAGNEMFPFITIDTLLYFASNGLDGIGGLDIYEVKIKNGVPRKVYNMGKPVNSQADDFGITLADDGMSGYISSNRLHGGTNDDIFSLAVLRKVKRGKTVNIVTKDKDSGELLANTRILINNDSVRTNDKGEYQTIIEDELSYRLNANKTDYFDVSDSVSTRSSEEDEFTKTLLLEKDPKLALVGFVLDAKDNTAIDGAKITVLDNTPNTIFDQYTTTAAGDYRKSLYGKKIGDKLNYQITLEKAGYLKKVITFTYDITKPGDIQLNELLNMRIGKVAVGMDLAKMIDIKPIYFDLGKSKVRPDAAIELDKVVAAMKEYPNMIIELGSHTDCRSTAASNLKLSDARAKASAAYIVKKGIPKIRILGKGYGEKKILNGCICEGKVKPTCSEDDHAKNRRTEFIITKLK